MTIPENVERKYLPHLTGFRAIAAYLVLIAHSLATTYTYGSIHFFQEYFTCVSCLGMSIFFVLSGFVITYTYYNRFIQFSWLQTTRNFAVARFARLYPLYILILLLERDFYKPLFRHGSVRELISYFTLTQSWWNMDYLVFVPAWSISTECFFYVCFALWMLFPSTIRPLIYVQRMAIITLVGILLILLAVFVMKADILALLSPMLGRTSHPNVWGWLQYHSPYVRIGEFIAGVCAARMYMVTQHDANLPLNQQRAAIFCIGSIIAIILFMIINAKYMIENNRSPADSFWYCLSQNFGYAPFLAYIFYACSRYPNLLTKLCCAPVMQFGGEISYSVYILQFEIFRRVLRDQVAGFPSQLTYEISFLKAILYIVLTTIIAYCSYRIIEIPSRHLLRKLLARE